MRARENFLCLRSSQHVPIVTSRACPPSQTSAVLGRKTPMGVGAVASARGCGWWHKQKMHTGCANDQSRGQRESCPAGRTPGRVAWGHKPLPGPWNLGLGFRAQPQHASNTGACLHPGWSQLSRAKGGHLEMLTGGGKSWGGGLTRLPQVRTVGARPAQGPEPGRSQCQEGDAVVGSPQRPLRGSQQQRPPREES